MKTFYRTSGRCSTSRCSWCCRDAGECSYGIQLGCCMGNKMDSWRMSLHTIARRATLMGAIDSLCRGSFWKGYLALEEVISRLWALAGEERKTVDGCSMLKKRASGEDCSRSIRSMARNRFECCLSFGGTFTMRDKLLWSLAFGNDFWECTLVHKMAGGFSTEEGDIDSAGVDAVGIGDTVEHMGLVVGMMVADKEFADMVFEAEGSRQLQSSWLERDTLAGEDTLNNHLEWDKVEIWGYILVVDNSPHSGTVLGTSNALDHTISFLKTSALA